LPGVIKHVTTTSRKKSGLHLAQTIFKKY